MWQLIVVRKDLNMFAGKLAAQVSHASMAFLTAPLRDAKGDKNGIKRIENGEYVFEIKIDAETYNDWVCGIFTKTICEARNRNQLLKAKKMTEELGMEEGEDFFLIKDNCLTELEPEEMDEDGVGRTLTCIGFRPLPDDVAHEISRKFQLYRTTQKTLERASEGMPS